MSKATLDAIAKREAAKQPKPKAAAAPKPKAEPTPEDGGKVV